MTLFNRTIIAVTLSLTLAACGSDDSKDSNNPVTPQPLLPLPTETIDVNVAGVAVKALKESVVITSTEGEEQRVAVEAFKGIKFAEAERFVHSSVVDLADSTDATQFGDVCPQLATKTVNDESGEETVTFIGEEDCLNLNIWRPTGLEGSENLPVYVFIHGGDFEYGAGSDEIIHGDKVVAQGVADDHPFIMVTFNYRLGLLGTAWVDGEQKTEGGNFGLGDQKRALQWVHENIESFGGNASSVTLMGQGSGAMSVGILQQESSDDVTDYFDRAIMQSNPYGFDYRDYKSAKNLYGTSVLGLGYKPFSDTYANAELSEVMGQQVDLLAPTARLLNWVVKGVNSENVATPMSELMPFAPYIDSSPEECGLFNCTDPIDGNHLRLQPALTDLSVQTVLGSNSEESNSFGMLPSLTFLIPTIIELCKEEGCELPDSSEPEQLAQVMVEWLESPQNRALLQQKLSIVTAEEVTTQGLSAYEAVTKLFFGLGNSDTTDELLALRDYEPHLTGEGSLVGAMDNMGKFKLLLNDILFTGPARLKAKETAENVTFYHFEYKPSFNVKTGQPGDIGDLIKSIGCISGACNGSELPFVFNKAMKLDGTTVKPSSKDLALMNKMSRLWFKDDLFDSYQYDSKTDSVLVINKDADITLELDWDQYSNVGIDQETLNGRLNGLQEMGLILGYLPESAE